MNPKEVIAMNDDILHSTSSEEETIEPDTFFSEHEHEVVWNVQADFYEKQGYPNTARVHSSSEHQRCSGIRQVLGKLYRLQRRAAILFAVHGTALWRAQQGRVGDGKLFCLQQRGDEVLQCQGGYGEEGQPD